VSNDYLCHSDNKSFSFSITSLPCLSPICASRKCVLVLRHLPPVVSRDLPGAPLKALLRRSKPITINPRLSCAQTHLRQFATVHLPARRTQEQTETSPTAPIQPPVDGPWAEERLYTALPVSLEGLAHLSTQTDTDRSSSIRPT